MNIFGLPGSETFNDLYVNNQETDFGSLDVKGGATFESDVTIDGKVVIDGDVEYKANVTVDGNAHVVGTLRVDSTSDLKGAVTSETSTSTPIVQGTSTSLTVRNAAANNTSVVLGTTSVVETAGGVSSTLAASGQTLTGNLHMPTAGQIDNGGSSGITFASSSLTETAGGQTLLLNSSGITSSAGLDVKGNSTLEGTTDAKGDVTIETKLHMTNTSPNAIIDNSGSTSIALNTSSLVETAGGQSATVSSAGVTSSSNLHVATTGQVDNQGSSSLAFTGSSAVLTGGATTATVNAGGLTTSSAVTTGGNVHLPTSSVIDNGGTDQIIGFSNSGSNPAVTVTSGTGGTQLATLDNSGFTINTGNINTTQNLKLGTSSYIEYGTDWKLSETSSTEFAIVPVASVSAQTVDLGANKFPCFKAPGSGYTLTGDPTSGAVSWTTFPNVSISPCCGTVHCGNPYTISVNPGFNQLSFNATGTSNVIACTSGSGGLTVGLSGNFLISISAEVIAVTGINGYEIYFAVGINGSATVPLICTGTVFNTTQNGCNASGTFSVALNSGDAISMWTEISGYVGGAVNMTVNSWTISVSSAQITTGGSTPATSVSVDDSASPHYSTGASSVTLQAEIDGLKSGYVSQALTSSSTPSFAGLNSTGRYVSTDTTQATAPYSNYDGSLVSHGGLSLGKNLIMGGGLNCASTAIIQGALQNLQLTASQAVFTDSSQQLTSTMPAVTTYTPTISDGTTSFTMSLQQGQYRQIGAVIMATIKITWTSVNGATGGVRVSLPSTVSTSCRKSCAALFTNGLGMGGGTMLQGGASAGDNFIVIYSLQTNGTQAPCLASNATASGEVDASIFYW